MLTIKRVPTVVSNYQEDSDDLAAGCGRKCVGKCCLLVSKLPLYAFKPKHQAEKKFERKNSDPELSFNSLLLGQWEDRMNRGLFRYDVTTCETKVIPGRHGFIAQLNEGRQLKWTRSSNHLIPRNSTSQKLDKKRCCFDSKRMRMKAAMNGRGGSFPSPVCSPLPIQVL